MHGGCCCSYLFLSLFLLFIYFYSKDLLDVALQSGKNLSNVCSSMKYTLLHLPSWWIQHKSTLRGLVQSKTASLHTLKIYHSDVLFIKKLSFTDSSLKKIPLKYAALIQTWTPEDSSILCWPASEAEGFKAKIGTFLLHIINVTCTLYMKGASIESQLQLKKV